MDASSLTKSHWFYGAPSLQDYLDMGWQNVPAAVYFIQSGDFIKIGYSKQPERRVAQIRRGGKAKRPSVGLLEDPVLLAYYPGTKADERALHQRFAEVHDQGEWFNRSPELDALIDKAARMQAEYEVDVHIASYEQRVRDHGWPPMDRLREDLVFEQMKRNSGAFDELAA